MSKISYEKKKKLALILNKLSYPETVNERIVRAMNSKMIDGFLPIVVSQKKKEIVMVCDISGMQPLDEYFTDIVTKTKFLFVVKSIIGFIRTCEKNMISPNNLDLQKDRVFIDPKSHKVTCIFWPIINNQLERSPAMFLEQLSSGFVFNQHEDTSYIVQYNAFFERQGPFSINAFDSFIQRLMGEEKQTVLSPSGNMMQHNERKQASAQKETTKHIEYNPFAQYASDTRSARDGEPKQIACSYCGTQNSVDFAYCAKCGRERRKNTHANFDGTTVLGLEGFDGTTVLECDEDVSAVCPYMIRTANNEKIMINKPVFRIGKDNTCDYAVSNNVTVSRKHAEIVVRGNRFYIRDLNSLNKTYANDLQVLANQETEIFMNTRIRLATELFEFYIS